VLEEKAIASRTPIPGMRRVICEKEVRRRRARNRENMRRRRADPVYRAIEKRRREEHQGGPTSLELVRVEQGHVLETSGRCAICRKRSAVEVITRLRPSAKAKSGYVEMRLGYCGFC
jgi:hypothetical protein